jgi:hypothetical protein
MINGLVSEVVGFLVTSQGGGSGVPCAWLRVRLFLRVPRSAKSCANFRLYTISDSRSAATATLSHLVGAGEQVTVINATRLHRRDESGFDLPTSEVNEATCMVGGLYK